MTSTNTEANAMEVPKHTNALVSEKSPYLLQHAHNPVQWYPWCQEAIDKAKKKTNSSFSLWATLHAIGVMLWKKSPLKMKMLPKL